MLVAAGLSGLKAISPIVVHLLQFELIQYISVTLWTHGTLAFYYVKYEKHTIKT